MPRKRRTRQHVIAELSVNYVERQALLSGFSGERIEHDYGVDLMLFTYNADGEIENGHILVQLKATDDLKLLLDQRTIACPVKRADLEFWLDEPMPVVLVVYDAQVDVAYWLYLQAYFADQPGFDLSQVGDTITVHIPTANMVDQGAMGKFAEFRDTILKQLRGAIRYGV